MLEIYVLTQKFYPDFENIVRRKNCKLLEIQTVD